MEIIGDNVSIGYFKNEKLNSQKFEKKYEKEASKQEILDILKWFTIFLQIEKMS